MFLKLTGARVSSPARLEIKDINLEARTIAFKTMKGSRAEVKIYQFPIHDKLLSFFSKNFSLASTNQNTKGFLFINAAGEPFNAKHFASRIRKALSKSGLRNKTRVNLNLHGKGS